MNIKKFQFFLILFIIYFFNFFGREFGSYTNFIITGIINFIFTYYLLKINPFKKTGLFLIFFPLLLLSLVVFRALINSIRIPGIVGYYICLLATSFGTLLYLYNKKALISCIYSILFIVSVLNFNNIFNYYYSLVDKNINVGKVLPIITVIDINGSSKIIESKGKILLIDLWSNSCGNCIKSFPKFEKLKNEYAKDNEVEILAINIYNSKKEIIESEKFLKKYSFKNYYCDQTLFDKLNFNSIPNYMIVGRDNKIKYFGNLNMETFETYNNIYKLIENEK
jgi:thiol-disulfide isomerase/thioredoxin